MWDVFKSYPSTWYLSKNILLLGINATMYPKKGNS